MEQNPSGGRASRVAARAAAAAAPASGPPHAAAGPVPPIVERAQARGFRTAAEMLEADLRELRGRLEARERGELLEAPVAFKGLEERVASLENRVGELGARVGTFGPELEALIARVAELEAHPGKKK